MKAPDLAGFASRRMLVVSAVLFLSIGVNLLAWHVVQLSLRTSTMRTFEEHASRTERAIQDRMHGYEQVLRGGAGLFAAAELVNRDVWRRYVEAARIREVFPGVRGLHYASRVAPADLAAHVASIKAEGFPAYAIRPEGSRDEYFPIIWPEPMDERNQRAIGFDMFSEPVRHAAMEQARDTGIPTISGKVTLTGDAAAPIPGFNYYMPIYARNMPLTSVEERRRAIRGFIFCPFRMLDLMQGLLGQELEVLNIEIYDGAQPTAAGLMFSDSSAQNALNEDALPKLSVKREMKVGEHTWVVYFEASRAFIASSDSSGPRWLLLAGLLISAVMAVAVWRLLTREDKAVSESLHDGLTGLPIAVFSKPAYNAKSIVRAAPAPRWRSCNSTWTFLRN